MRCHSGCHHGPRWESLSTAVRITPLRCEPSDGQLLGQTVNGGEVRLPDAALGRHVYIVGASDRANRRFWPTWCSRVTYAAAASNGFETMPTYSREDFEQIATVIGNDVARVCRHEKRFEAAALWYRISQRARKDHRTTPFVMHKRMTQIANAARKLLGHLGVNDPAEAPDGPEISVLEVLASAFEGEDPVVRATARIGRLVEILEAVEAARELERRAHIGADDVVRIGKLIVPKGHHGKAAVNDWIEAMMSIYKQITGRDPGITIVGPSRPSRGKATGPLIRFLEAAGKPLGIQLSPASFASRIKDVRTGGRRRRK
jgi:hypothetical protein